MEKEILDPVIHTAEASAFTSGAPKKLDEGIYNKDEIKKTSQNVLETVSEPVSALELPNNIRLIANIREDLYLRIKLNAAKQKTTVDKLIEKLIENYVEKEHS